MGANRDNWKIVVAGECMATRPFSMHDDSRSMGVVELLRNSDVTYAHLEMNFANFDQVGWPAKAGGGGSFMIAEPSIAQELRWAGIDMVSLAHNHTFDFGSDVILSTIEHSRRAGLTPAGTGRDLEEAREPAYLETRKGRVALISASSGNPPYQCASLPKAAWPARPGVNPQRHSTRYMVDRATADQLKMAAKELGVLSRRGTEDEFGIASPGERNASGSWVAGDRFEVQSSCHARDLAGNIRSVEEARAMADLVIVAHHFSSSDGPRGDTPPMFAREFARAMIDAGADLYCGHGWHRTLGIEIYKGRPIFYGLGNFFAQTEFIRRVPYDSYESYGHDLDLLPTLNPRVFPLHPGYSSNSDLWWNSAILGVEIEDFRVSRITLHPVDLGRDVDREVKISRPTGRGPHTFTEGRPMIADADNAQLILERYRRLSKDLGTSIVIQDGIGVIGL